MKLLKSIILALGFLFLTFTPILALTCPAAGECAYFSCNQQLIYSQYSGTGTSCPRNLAPGFCSNGYPSNDPCNNNNNGGGGGLSTNIDAQAQGFFAYQSFDKFLPNLLQLALILGAVAAFAFLIWGAIDYIISGGNQERVKTAKTMIGNALAGLAILAAVWVIWRLITYFLGLSPTIKGPFDIKLPTP